jgi:phage-related protein
MPAKDIKETLKDKRGRINFQVMFTDFPYAYSHENPFPIFKTEKSELVDKSFEHIFSQIAFSLQ